MPLPASPNTQLSMVEDNASTQALVRNSILRSAIAGCCLGFELGKGEPMTVEELFNSRQQLRHPFQLAHCRSQPFGMST